MARTKRSPEATERVIDIVSNVAISILGFGLLCVGAASIGGYVPGMEDTAAGCGVMIVGGAALLIPFMKAKFQI